MSPFCLFLSNYETNTLKKNTMHCHRKNRRKTTSVIFEKLETEIILQSLL